jgi:hypothetical protein
MVFGAAVIKLYANEEFRTKAESQISYTKDICLYKFDNTVSATSFHFCKLQLMSHCRSSSQDSALSQSLVVETILRT